VGLRENIEHVKSSSFTQEGDAVYVVTLKMIQLHDVWEGQGSWSGEWNTAKVVEFIHSTRKLASVSGVNSLRTVSSQGVVTTLMKMSLDGIAVDGAAMSKAQSQANGLYQLVVSGRDLEKTLTSIFTANTVEIVKLGSTQKVDSASAQKSIYEKAWGKHFENLA
jgi:hypothetical protein